MGRGCTQIVKNQDLFTVVRQHGAGKSFTQKLVNLSKKAATGSEKPPSTNTEFAAKKSIEALVPVILDPSVRDAGFFVAPHDKFHNLSTEHSLFMLIDRKYAGVLDKKFAWKLIDSNLTTYEKTTIRAVNTSSFLGVKFSTTYEQYSKIAWLNLVFQIMRSVQAIKLARIEDFFLRGNVTKEQGHSPTINYAHDVFAVLDMLRIPILSVKPTGWTDKFSLRLTTSGVVPSGRVAYTAEGNISNTILHWLFELLADAITDSSAGFLRAHVSQNTKVVGVLPEDGALATRWYELYTNYYSEGAPRSNNRQSFFAPLVQHPRSLFGWSLDGKNLLPSGLISALSGGFFDQVRYAELAGVDILQDEDWETTPVISDSAVRAPIRIGTTIGLHRAPRCTTDTEKKDHAGGCKKTTDAGFFMYPTIRIELKNLERNMSDSIIMFAPPKLITVKELL